MNQHEGWNGVFEYEWKSREDERAEWKSLFQGRGPIGMIPVIEFQPVRARYVRLEVKKLWKLQPLQIGGLRLFPPLE